MNDDIRHCRTCKYRRKSRQGEYVCVHNEAHVTAWNGVTRYARISEPIMGEKCGPDYRLWEPSIAQRMWSWIFEKVFGKDKSNE